MITVLMSVYNSAPFLAAAIRSTLRQTYRQFEFLIVDDGSRDDSLAICRHYAARDSRIRIIAHENWGAPASLNDAARQARGNWLFRMDPDDVMLPTRLAQQRMFLRRNPDLAVASAQVYFIDQRGRIVGRSNTPLTTTAAMAAANASDQLIAFHHPATAMRKDAFLAVGGYRPHCWPADDLDLWARLAEAGYPMLVQDEVVLKYRIHGASISLSASKKQVQAVDWVQQCKAARRAGQPEQTFEQFLQQQAKLPLPQRLAWRNGVLARTLYKAGVQHWTTRDYLHGVPRLAAAFALRPSLFVGRAWPRLLSHVSPVSAAAPGVKQAPTAIAA